MIVSNDNVASNKSTSRDNGIGWSFPSGPLGPPGKCHVEDVVKLNSRSFRFFSFFVVFFSGQLAVTERDFDPWALNSRLEHSPDHSVSCSERLYANKASALQRHLVYQQNVTRCCELSGHIDSRWFFVATYKLSPGVEVQFYSCLFGEYGGFQSPHFSIPTTPRNFRIVSHASMKLPEESLLLVIDLFFGLRYHPMIFLLESKSSLSDP